VQFVVSSAYKECKQSDLPKKQMSNYFKSGSQQAIHTQKNKTQTKKNSIGQNTTKISSYR